MRRAVASLTLLNLLLLVNLYAVSYALASWAASIVWWGEALVVAGPLLAIAGAVLAARQRSGRAYVIVNLVFLVPYVLFFWALLRP